MLSKSERENGGQKGTMLCSGDSGLSLHMNGAKHATDAPKT